MKNKIVRATVLLMISNFAGKFFGMFREILMAKYYGTSVYTDAYIIANSMPTVLFSVMGAALSTTFIPMYAKIRRRQGKSDADAFTLTLIGAVSLFCAVLCLIGELFPAQVALLFAYGFRGEVLAVTVRYARILFPSIFGIALMNLFGSYLQSHHCVAPIAAVPVIGNIVIIIALFLSNYFSNVEIFVWGTLGGLASQALFYLPWVWRRRLFSVRPAHPSCLADLAPLMLPVFLGEAVHELNSIVDKTVASGLEAGSVAALNFSFKIVNLINGVITVSLVTILFPRFAAFSANQDLEGLKKSGAKSILYVALTLLPLTAFVLAFRQDIVKILFERGNFDRESAFKTTVALGCYAFGLCAMGVREIVMKMFYAIQNTKIPMTSGVLGATVNIVLDFALTRWIGFRGLPLATSIAAWIAMSYLLFFASRYSLFSFKSVSLRFLLGAGACAAFYLFLSAVRGRLLETFGWGLPYWLLCGVLTCAAVGVYLGIAFLPDIKGASHFHEQ